MDVGPTAVVIISLGGCGVSPRMLALPRFRSSLSVVDGEVGQDAVAGGALRADQAGPAVRGALGGVTVVSSLRIVLPAPHRGATPARLRSFAAAMRAPHRGRARENRGAGRVGPSSEFGGRTGVSGEFRDPQVVRHNQPEPVGAAYSPTRALPHL